jgi:integrase
MAVCASRDSKSPDPGRSAGARLVARNFDRSKAHCRQQIVRDRRSVTRSRVNLLITILRFARSGPQAAVQHGIKLQVSDHSPAPSGPDSFLSLGEGPWRGEPIQKLRRAWASVAGGKDAPHVVRHTAATWLMQAGVDAFEAAGYLGMSVETLLEVYGQRFAKSHDAVLAVRRLRGLPTTCAFP